jgi:hypothetical protein
MDNLLQPDFVITIDGLDVTNLCKKWEIHDIEDAISSATITLVNPSMKLSGQFNAGQTLSMRWGYQNNLSAEIEMEVKDYSENYDNKGRLIIIKAKDCMQKMVGSNMRGNFEEGTGIQDAIRDITKSHGITEVDFGTAQDPVQPKDWRTNAYGVSSLGAVERLKNYMANPQNKSASSDSLPVARNQAQSGGGKFKGNTGTGNFQGEACQSRDCQEKEGGEGSPAKNKLDNTTAAAASINIRGHLDIVGKTAIRAKTMITILNVGPQASGDWYVKAANHTWDVKDGYRTRCDLIRNETGKGGGKGSKCGQPIVSHADIYKKNSMYCGPRKYGEGSSGTYTFGSDNPMIESFKMSVSVSESSGAGEKGNAERILPDNSEKSNDGTGIPLKTGKSKK